MPSKTTRKSKALKLRRKLKKETSNKRKYMSEIEIKEIISIYKSKDLLSLSFCELKEFRKYLLLDGDEALGKKIYSRMEA